MMSDIVWYCHQLALYYLSCHTSLITVISANFFRDNIHIYLEIPIFFVKTLLELVANSLFTPPRSHIGPNGNKIDINFRTNCWKWLGDKNYYFEIELLLKDRSILLSCKSHSFSADGNFEVTLATKATLFHTGAVEVKTLTLLFRIWHLRWRH